TCLSTLVSRDPGYADAWVILSNCHFMLGNLDESVRSFMTAYGIDKNDIRDLVKRASSAGGRETAPKPSGACRASLGSSCAESPQKNRFFPFTSRDRVLRDKVL
ncbi:MAG TPA: hypothetical protein PLV88_04550, partial [Methanoregulaceae archaeon]|nr:hypothetical protein [Methanoregulaceae archaeon]